MTRTPWARSRPLLAAMLALILAACATAPMRTADKLSTASAVTGEHRILLLPLDVELSELGAVSRDVRADWTESAKGHLRTALREELRSIQGRLKVLEEQPNYDAGDPTQVQILKLNEAVGQSIWLFQHGGPASLPTKRDTFDWTLGPDVAYLKRRHDADYALFVFVRDSYSTGGRVALAIFAAAFGVAVPGGTQAGFASLVDLSTGNVVWYNRLIRGTGDLRDEPAARETTKALLASFPR